MLYQLLDIVCISTGMMFAAFARLTKDKWITSASKDMTSFRGNPIDELKVETVF